MLVQIWHLLKARRCGEQRPAVRFGPARGAFHASEEDRSILDRRLLFWQAQVSNRCMFECVGEQLTDDKSYVGKSGTYSRSCSDEEIYTFAIGKS